MASTINITKSSPGNIIITGKWTWYDYYKVEYSWENAPNGVTLPETINKIKNGSIIAVDTTYNSSSEVDTNDYYYTFSGWDKNGNITVNADTTITGIWTQNRYLTVSYSWTDAPNGVTLPNSTTKLKPGDSVTVDTTYNSSSEVDTNDYYYTFSGWDKNGNITVNADTTITGIWTQNRYLTVSYSWTDAPTSVTLPNSTTKLKPGDNVTVDTTYTSDSTVDINYTWTKGTISSTTSYTCVCYGNGKFVAGARMTKSNTSFAYSTDGINWTESTISDTNRDWRSICYGNGKFVAVGTKFTSSSSSTTSMGRYSAYSTDGITWTLKTLNSNGNIPESVCYGNDKFVVVGEGYIGYSTDGISWTSINTSRYWTSVCYGNGKFVAVTYNSNYFAYSTDGINWTEGTISSTSRYWNSVCYGNDKFVAVANKSYFAYSTDGITWTEGMISSTSRSWGCICYGNGKFVAVATNTIYFAYSTDGITWTESTISDTSRSWNSVCYGNPNNKDIYIAVDVNQTYYYSNLSGNEYYYSFSGWDKTGNIAVTKDTVISGVWTIHDYLKVSYSWTNAPSSVTLPKTVTKLKPGDSVTVDTTYNSSSEVDTDIKEKVVLSERSISSTNRKWNSVCYGNGKFVAVDNTNYFAYSNDGITWSESTISDTSRQWNSVCYGNGKFVAVGSGDDNQHVGGTTSNTKNFAYSTDGIKWTEGALGYDCDWRSVCYGNGMFVTVANTFNYFAYSTDGIKWTKGTISDTNRYWNSVCYGNDKFVAVGAHIESSGGTEVHYNYFAYSTDGINWTESTISSTNRQWRSVCYGNGMFVTVANNSNYFAYSTDGITWTEGTISNTSRYWRSVCYGNDRFVAVAYNSNTFAYSTDSAYYYTFSGWDQTGNITVNADTTITGIWTLNKYLSVLYSWIDKPDGVTLPNTVTKLKPGDSVTVDTTYTSDNIVEEITNDWSESTISSTSRNLYYLNYCNDKFIALATGSNYFEYSTDGITWTESTISDTNRDWRTVCYGNGVYVAFALSSNYFAYSTDGITWTDKTLPASRNWYSMCYGNGKFVVVTYNSNYFAYSTDGITWTEGTISNTNRNWTSVCYGNGMFVTVALDSNYFAYSTNGINWTEGTISSTSRGWQSICYGGGKYITVAKNSNYFAYSTNGINWTEGTISSTERKWSSVCYGNGKFVAIANGTVFAYSTNGINWTEGTISSTSRGWQSICYGNNKFVAISYSNNISAYATLSDPGYYYQFSGWDQSGNITITSDTIITGIWNHKNYLTVSYSWTDAPISLMSTVPDSCSRFKPGDTYTVNNNYTSNTAKKDLNEWIESTISNNNRPWNSVCYGNGMFVAVANSKYFAYSTDGINWTEGTMSSGRNWYSVCYGNDKFVTVAYNSNYFAYSTDGINWTEGTISSTKRYWRSVCYGNDKFVAVAGRTSSTSNYFAYSTDGINWTENTISDTSRKWMSVCYGNGMFVATGNASNYFAYSTDGITWTEGTISSTSRYWNYVCYGNDKFVTVAYNSKYFAYSTDGINWTESTISSTSRQWERVCYGNGMFVIIAVANGTAFAYSTDGINWTESKISSTNRDWRSICYGNGVFVIVTYNNNNYFAYSTLDKIYYQFSGWDQTGNITINSDTTITGIWSKKDLDYSWNTVTVSDSNNVPSNEVCYGNDKFVVVGGLRVGYSTNGIDWSINDMGLGSRNWISVCYGNDKFIAVSDSSANIAYSTDGINWTAGSTKGTSIQLYSVCYGNDKFVVVGTHWSNKLVSGSYKSIRDQITSFSSSDGITWTENKISTNVDSSNTSRDTAGVHICYGNDKFVVIWWNTNSNKSLTVNGFAYSYDGMTWTEGTISDTKRRWYSICYGNDKFVAVASSSKYFAYSTDGINWTEGTISNTSRYWMSVCYGKDKFVAVANNDNYFAYSTDGINWTESTISNTNRDWHSVCYGKDKFVAVTYGTVFAYYSKQFPSNLNFID